LSLTYISDDRQLSNGVKNAVPDTNVTNPLGYRPAKIRQQFLGIKTHFKDVVQQGKKWSQWEGSNEDCDKPILQN
jgi:hypothetical protein